jgi:hypothetical protein
MEAATLSLMKLASDSRYADGQIGILPGWPLENPPAPVSAERSFI